MKACNTWYLIMNSRHVILQKQPEVFYKNGVLKNFAKKTKKHQCQSLFLIELQV